MLDVNDEEVRFTFSFSVTFHLTLDLYFNCCDIPAINRAPNSRSSTVRQT